MNNNSYIIIRILEILKRKLDERRWRRIVTFLAGIVVFCTTYALILPAFSTQHAYLTLQAEKAEAVSGEELCFRVTADGEGTEKEQIIVLVMEGEGADLSPAYIFDENGECVITDDNREKIVLHRSIREKDAADASGKKSLTGRADAAGWVTVDYWFTLAAGASTSFTLGLADKMTPGRFEKIMEQMKQTVRETATPSAAAKDTKAIIPEEEALPGAALKISACIGYSYEKAIRNAGKNAGKQSENGGDDELEFVWTEEGQSCSGLVKKVGDAVVAAVCTDGETLPEGAWMDAFEIMPGTPEYEQYVKRAADAVTASQDEEKSVTRARFFDITVRNAEGNEIRLENPVKLVIRCAKTAGGSEGDGDTNVVRLGGGADEVVCPEEVESGDGSDEFTFTAEKFTVFGVVCTVDFHYAANGQTYDFSIPKSGSVSLEYMAEVLGIAGINSMEGSMDAKTFAAGVEKVESSSPDLVRAEKTEDWTLTSMKPFPGEEKLTVVMKNGDMFTVNVTDAQTSSKVLTADGRDCRITVIYDKKAMLPAKTKLIVREIRKSSDMYRQLVGRTWVEVNKEYFVPIINIDYGRFFDITFENNNKPVKPKAPVQVVIRCEDEQTVEQIDERIAGVSWFKNTSMVGLIDGVRVEKDKEGKAAEFIYRQDSFSHAGIYIAHETGNQKAKESGGLSIMDQSGSMGRSDGNEYILYTDTAYDDDTAYYGCLDSGLYVPLNHIRDEWLYWQAGSGGGKILEYDPEDGIYYISSGSDDTSAETESDRDYCADAEDTGKLPEASGSEPGADNTENEKGWLRLHKSVKYEGQDPRTAEQRRALAGTYTFKIFSDETLMEDALIGTASITIGGDGLPRYCDPIELPAGTCWIEEEAAEGKPVYAMEDNPRRVEITAADTASAPAEFTVTNNYHVNSGEDTCTIDIEKRFEGLDEADLPQGYGIILQYHVEGESEAKEITLHKGLRRKLEDGIIVTYEKDAAGTKWVWHLTDIPLTAGSFRIKEVSNNTAGCQFSTYTLNRTATGADSEEEMAPDEFKDINMAGPEYAELEEVDARKDKNGSTVSYWIDDGTVLLLSLRGQDAGTAVISLAALNSLEKEAVTNSIRKLPQVSIARQLEFYSIEQHPVSITPSSRKPITVGEEDGRKYVMMQFSTSSRYDVYNVTYYGEPAFNNEIIVSRYKESTDIEFVKVTEDTLDAEIKATLPGAVFQITRLDEETTSSHISYLMKTVGGEPAAAYQEVSAPTGQDGKTGFTGLEPGYYEIKEIDSPDGYIFLDDAIYIRADQSGVVEYLEKPDAAAGPDSPIAEWTSFSTGGNVRFDGHSSTFTIGSTPGEELPKTGGPGTLAYKLSGSILTIFAGVLLLRRRRAA